MVQRLSLSHILGLLFSASVVYYWFEPWVLLQGGMYQSGEHIGGKAYLFLVGVAIYVICLIIRQYEIALMAAMGIAASALGMHWKWEANGSALLNMGIFGVYMLQPSAQLFWENVKDVEDKTPLQKAALPLLLITYLLFFAMLAFLLFSWGTKLFSATPKETAPPVTEQQVPSIEEARAAANRQDFATAAKLYQPLIDKGDSVAPLELGLLYEAGGNGLPQDHGKALLFYQLAANGGNSWGYHNMGVYYRDGLGGLPQKPEAALGMFRRAADLGNAQSQATVCHLSMGVPGYPKDFATAYRYCQMSADQNDPLGLNNLGVLYEYGWGVKKSRDKAFELYSAAAKKGNEIARENLDKLMHNHRF